jgi:hypothetical protein
MPLNTHFSAVSLRLAPLEPRRAPIFCLALLVGACVLASFALPAPPRSQPLP